MLSKSINLLVEILLGSFAGLIIGLSVIGLSSLILIGLYKAVMYLDSLVQSVFA